MSHDPELRRRWLEYEHELAEVMALMGEDPAGEPSEAATMMARQRHKHARRPSTWIDTLEANKVRR